MFKKFVETCRAISPEEFQENDNRLSIPINNDYVQKILNIFYNEDAFYLYNVIKRVCWLNKFESIEELNKLLINVINEVNENKNNYKFKDYIIKKGLII